MTKKTQEERAQCKTYCSEQTFQNKNKKKGQEMKRFED